MPIRQKSSFARGSTFCRLAAEREVENNGPTLFSMCPNSVFRSCRMSNIGHLNYFIFCRKKGEFGKEKKYSFCSYFLSPKIQIQKAHPCEAMSRRRATPPSQSEACRRRGQRHRIVTEAPGAVQLGSDEREEGSSLPPTSVDANPPSLFFGIFSPSFCLPPFFSILGRARS
jgi:hypothetical protein